MRKKVAVANPSLYLEETKRSAKIIRTVPVPAEIPTGNLPNSIVKRYSYSQRVMSDVKIGSVCSHN
jgi:hypothetical protein